MSSDRIGDVFPADDPEARFIVAMSMARNDVKLAVQRAAQANADDAPEFGYFVRLSYGHLAEGLEALQRWRQHCPEVRRFLKTLPQDATRQRAEAEACLKTAMKRRVDRVRHRTFHYPSPNPRKQPDFDSELREVLAALADEQALIVAAAENPGNLRLHFADRVALLLALGEDEPTQTELETILQGSVSFARFIGGALATYLGERK